VKRATLDEIADLLVEALEADNRARAGLAPKVTVSSMAHASPDKRPRRRSKGTATPNDRGGDR
jgi:hypothetical protein